MHQYTYRAEWSPEYGEYVAMCIELPARYARAPTAHAALERIEQVVEESVAEIIADGGTPPASLTDRHYSGTFVVRTSSALHGRLAVEAAEQGVSLNHLVALKLADRPSVSLDDLF
jgi:predicted HicB family RNase H-like nuclease